MSTKKLQILGSVGQEPVQPDLNQSDETAPDFVKGRTHYAVDVYSKYDMNDPYSEDIEEPDYAPSYVLKFVGSPYKIFTYERLGQQIWEGTYVVEFDGTEYTLEAQEYGYMWSLGSINEDDPDNFTGFQIYPSGGYATGEEDTYIKLFDDDGETEHTLSIKCFQRSELKKLDPKFLPTGTVVADGESGTNMMLVTDGSGVTKWDERTHYVGHTKSYDIENYAFTDDGNIHYTGMEVPTSEFVVGMEYIIEFDGVAYTAIAEESGDYCSAIGDRSFDECPVRVRYNFESDCYEIWAATTGDHTLSVYTLTETVKPLDEKFIPDSIPRMTKGVGEVLLGECDTYGGGSTGTSSAKLEFDSSNIKVGDTIRVIYDGTEYTDEVEEHESGVLFIGSWYHETIDIGDEGYPYQFLLKFTETGGRFYTQYDDAENHHSVIYGPGIVDVPIDEKFIPETCKLPAVTTEDTGKVLRVDAEGKWVAEALANAEEASF